MLPGDLQGRSQQFYEDILHVISHFNVEFKGVAYLIRHDDMKISDMLFPISIYSSRGWQILIPHDDMKTSYMLFPISI